MLKTLSIGEQRLLLLARALIKNPPLLILDEPCQGLDETQAATLLKWIDEICLAGNKTMVFVTHYQNQKPECVTRTLSLPAPASLKGGAKVRFD
jgi:molybdate transport system ATP-binding protein